ncbi:MAG TPA: exodeoxyribonuclease V subunit alpha [Acidimicrobiales bacterium]|nr:exodeoxyribonuclease V subunit alpha [Acidimicrobiales bacterium]
MVRVPDMHPSAEALLPYLSAGIFQACDVQVAQAVSRNSSESDPEVLLAIALCVRAVRDGKVCLELDSIADSFDLDGAQTAGVELPKLPKVDHLIERLRKSEVVQCPGDASAVTPRPLVLEDRRLYLERYWRYELDVGRFLLDRAKDDGGLFRETDFDNGALAAIFAQSSLEECQQRGVLRALTHRLTVISGGPGTGKTKTIAVLFRCVNEIAALRGRRILPALAAPTATAAKRITEALHQGNSATKATLESESPPAQVQATTLHRLLGANPARGFAHNRHHPLPHDLVVVDEVSMVSLPLLARLLESVKPDTSLVLVGDPYQLESVDAGAVLGEIVGSSYSKRSSGPIGKTIVHLEHQHRFEVQTALAALADAIRSGSADDAIGILSDESSIGLEWIHDATGLEMLYQRAAANALEVIEAARRGDSGTALDQLVSLKVICATRYGPRGVFQWSSTIEQIVKSRNNEYISEHDWYIGRPIIVNRNDYLNQLFNGDTGVVVDLERPVAMFPGATQMRSVPLARLREIDTWWAMTIHKSQGSQFKEVIVSLPDAPSPVLTRELLYTAVTRATENVSIVAGEHSLRVAISRQSQRASGLSNRLWGAFE